MTDFKPSRTVVRTSTIAGGKSADRHDISGAVFLHNIQSGVSASAPSTVAINAQNQLILTAGGGSGGSASAGGSDTQVQFNDGGTLLGGDANFTWHKGAERLFITASAACQTAVAILGSLTASCDISASAFFGDGTGLTGVTPGAAGNNTNIQFNSSGAMAGDDDLTWDGSILNVTGVMYFSGTTPSASCMFISGAGPFPNTNFNEEHFSLVVDEGKDATMVCGNAFIGYTGFVDRAVFGHKDSIPPNDFAFMQKGQSFLPDYEKGSVSINCPADGYLSFAVSTAHKARFSQMANAALVSAPNVAQDAPNITSNQSGFGIGTNYFPSYPLDISGGIRVGVWGDKMQNNTGSAGQILPTVHFITGTILHTGSYILRGAPSGFAQDKFSDLAGLLVVTGAINQSGSAVTFHVPASGSVDDRAAFVVSGGSPPGGFSPDTYIVVDATHFWTRFDNGAAIPQNAFMNFGVGTGLAGPSGFTGDATITYNGDKLVISGSDNGVAISGSIFAHHITSGSIAGNGSYVGINNQNQLVLTASAGGGGGGTPGGSDTQVQFNDGGSAFGGEASFTYQKTLSRLSLTGALMQTGSYELSGGLTILSSTFNGGSNTPLLVRDDEPASARIGKAHIGHADGGGMENYASFAHRDFGSTSSFSLAALGAGGTVINTVAGGSIYLGQGGVPAVGQFDSYLIMRHTGEVGIGKQYSPVESFDVSGSTRLGGGDGQYMHQITGTLAQSGSTVTFRVPESNSAGSEAAFVISGGTPPGGFSPDTYQVLDATKFWMRFDNGVALPSNTLLNFGTGSGVSGPSGFTGDAALQYDGDKLIISGSGNGISISGSLFAHHIDSGSIAGDGSYVGLNENNQLVLTSSAGGGGGGTPGGPSASVQINDGAGGFTGDSSFAFVQTHYDKLGLGLNRPSQLYLSGTQADAVPGIWMEAGGVKLPYRQLNDGEGTGPGNSYYTASYDWHYIVGMDPDTGGSGNQNMRIELQDAASCEKGWTIVVKRAWTQATAYTLKIAPISGNFIDDIAWPLTRDLDSSYESLTLVSDGDRRWYTV